MNVYDFDGTIYKGDSTWDFYFWCLRRNPSFVRFLPRQGVAAAGYLLKQYDKTRMKEQFYCFLPHVVPISEQVQLFWKSHEQNLYSWYLSQKQPDDIIISASPQFLLAPVCEKLGIRLIASRVDPSTGKYTGKNCHGEEKVQRFHQEFPGAVPDCFYSDSLSDLPMAKISKSAFLVSGHSPKPWIL